MEAFAVNTEHFFLGNLYACIPSFAHERAVNDPFFGELLYFEEEDNAYT